MGDKTYDQLLAEARQEAVRYRETANRLIPQMYYALRAENLSKADARDRIEKDCIEFWDKRTIISALPSECKDQAKQVAGSMRGTTRRQLQQVFKQGAAESAAESIKESSESNGKNDVIEITKEELDLLRNRARELNTRTMELSIKNQRIETDLKNQRDLNESLQQTIAQLQQQQKSVSEPAGKFRQSTMDSWLPKFSEIVHLAHDNACPAHCIAWQKAKDVDPEQLAS